MPRSRAAPRPRPRPGCPRATAGVQQTTTAASSARSASSISCGLAAPRGTRRRGSAGRPGRSRRRTPRRSTSAPAGLWAPSTITSGWWPSTSNRPGIDTAAKPSSTDLGRRGASKKLSTAVSATAALSPWWRPCSGRNTSGYTSSGVRSVEQAAAEGELVLDARRSRARATRRRAGCSARGRAAPARDRSRRARAWRPGLTMPAFSRAMSASVGPAYSVWSSPTLVTTATWPSATFVASQRPSRPTSTHGHVDGDVGEPPEGGRRDDLEVRRPHPGDAPRGRRRRATCSANVLVVDRLAVARDPLVDPLEVRAGVGADASGPGPSSRRVIDLRRRALAVRAR